MKSFDYHIDLLFRVQTVVTVSFTVENMQVNYYLRLCQFLSPTTSTYDYLKN